MKPYLLASAIAVALQAAPSLSQQAPLVVEEVPQPQTGDVLKQGTPVNLATVTEINSQDNHIGERIELRVTDAVEFQGHTVIPIGTRGVGEITLVRRKGMWGKSGKVEFRPLYIELGGRQIPISALSSTRDKGDTGTAGVVASIVVMPLAGFFVTGTSARIPPLTAVHAELSEDLPVVFKTTEPAPMTVPPPAQQDQVQVQSVTQVAPTAVVKTVPEKPKE
jgi:hypothetical protein